MVIDTSAFLAIFFNEPERAAFLQAIREDGARLVSAANVLETSIVLEARQGELAGREFDLFLHRLHIAVVSVDETQVSIARTAWRHYGKGRHPAGLNFGDCFSYALCRTSGEPLLAKGNDFPKTDLRI